MYQFTITEGKGKKTIANRAGYDIENTPEVDSMCTLWLQTNQ